MDLTEIVSSFGQFMKKQNLCEESVWTTFVNHVEEHSTSKTAEEGEDTSSDLRQLIQELNGLLPSDKTECGDQLRCVGELVVKTEPQDEAESSEEGTQSMKEEPESAPNKEEKEKEKGPAIDPTLVQITASKAEIDRRVAAFQEHTRLEVNEGNIREFRSAMASGEASESSARTDATFLRRPNSTSRVQVSRVVNQYGPQTRCQSDPPGGDLGTKPGSGSVCDGVEERLSNMEQHIGVGADVDRTASVFKRLKDLEERILHLESLSPEYFNVMPPSKRQKTEPAAGKATPEEDDLSLGDINSKISTLRQSLGLRDL